MMCVVQRLKNKDYVNKVKPGSKLIYPSTGLQCSSWKTEVFHPWQKRPSLSKPTAMLVKTHESESYSWGRKG